MSATERPADSAALRDLRRGRDCFEKHAWAGAHDALSSADRLLTLAAEDLERLATSAYLTGRDEEYLRQLERVQQAYFEAGDSRRSARAAFWLGLRLLLRGETARANGWLSRAERLLAGVEANCAERGYLLLPAAQLQIFAGDCEGAYERAGRAVEIGERCRDADLVALAVHLQGRARIEQGRVAEGLSLLDEAMLAVTTGELSPVVTGLVYCSVIEGCHEVLALDRAHEWTVAFARWCAQQPEMVSFTGVCLVHRAEMMQRHGAWSDALEEARRACERCLEVNELAAANAYYQQGEVHRLRGDVEAAEQAYRSANRCGLDPQPGLALLRLAQGRGAVAAAAMRRVVGAAAKPSERMKMLPAYVEIMLATGDVAEAERASRELEDLARMIDTRAMLALAAHARGAVELAQGNALGAIPLLRSAFRSLQEGNEPYAAARVRVLLAQCCRASGDEEGAQFELAAARATFERLGAAPDLAALDDVVRDGAPKRPRGLTTRELEVLRWVATGKSNKQISSLLFLSEKTIERHVSNIFAKIGVGSRAAATAYAYEHDLVR